MVSLISYLSKTRRDRILTWTPQQVTQNNQNHFLMYDVDKTYQDSYAQIPGATSHPISLVKNIAGRHKISTEVVERILNG